MNVTKSEKELKEDFDRILKEREKMSDYEKKEVDTAINFALYLMDKSDTTILGAEIIV